MEIKMIKFIKNFRKDEDGAVTVDWVVLTAAVVGLAIAAYGAIQTSTSDVLADTGVAVGTASTWVNGTGTQP
jgi:Flp pilus assembly pilin Flp